MDSSNVIDPWTIVLESLVLDIARTAESHNKRYFFGGGFAIDLSLGKLSRRHADIDFHPIEEDAQWWQTWFGNKGYIISKDEDMKDYPHAFLLTNEKREYIADVYPVHINPHGEIFMYETHGGHGRWEGKSWDKVQKVYYKGVPVSVEHPESVLEQKLEHSHKYSVPLSKKHKHDLKLFDKSPK